MSAARWLEFAAAISVLLPWCWIAFAPSRPWDLQPIAEDLPPPRDPLRWPPLAVLVPARNEAEVLPDTLPTLLAQDYPGPFRVYLVDDRSTDGTAEVAIRVAHECDRGERLSVVRGAALPAGWVGKVWAMEQGLERIERDGASAQAYLLLSDADIGHAPNSVRRLVAESETEGLALNSRMARLRCRSRAERLLVPAYIYFFNLLYPMRRANAPRDRLAAAAGGCVLLRTAKLRACGAFSAIRDRIIDDIALARLVKRAGGRTRLALSREQVWSTRVYDEGPDGESTPLWRGDLWRMVRRSAFTELRHSWALLALCLGLLALCFLGPALVLLAGVGRSALAARVSVGGGVWIAAGAIASGLMAWTYAPVLGFFGLARWRVLTLPWVAVLYGAMTLDSAWQHLRGRGVRWR